MKIKKILIAVSILFIATCLLLGARYINDYFEYKKNDTRALINISTNLEVNADWEEVRHEIYCVRIPIGISLEEIEAQVGNITPIEIYRTHDLYLFYDLYFLDPYVNLRDMSLAFDEEGRLVYKSIYAGFGETMRVECP